MGFQKAKEIIYFSKKLTAQEAADLNLVNGVLPHSDLLPYCREQALQLVPPRGAGQAIQRIKRTMHLPYIEALSNALDLENEELTRCMNSVDFGEGLMARIEKREPRFSGK